MTNQENLQFILEKQWWFISCLSIHPEGNYEADLNLFEGNVAEVEKSKTSLAMVKKAEQIEQLVNTKLRTASEKDFFRVPAEHLPELIKVAHNMTVKCIWHPFLPVKIKYYDSKLSDYIEYNSLGYFEFEVFLTVEVDKHTLTSKYVQQFPNMVKGFSEDSEHSLVQYDKQDTEILLDIKSPLYAYLVSIDCGLTLPKFTDDFIDKHRKALGYWANIYSGQFEDYTEKTFRERLMFDPSKSAKKYRINLSHRAHELHLVNRNNAFVYLDKDNYAKKIEDNYVGAYKKYKYEHPPTNNLRKNLQLPIARMRSILFLFLIILDVLNELDVKIQDEYSFDQSSSIGDIYEAQSYLSAELHNVRVSMSRIDQLFTKSYYLELGYNRRDLYKNNIRHLYKLFQIELFSTQLDKKVSKIDTFLQQIIDRLADERNKRKEMLVQIVGILISVFGLLQIIDSLERTFSQLGSYVPAMKIILLVIVLVTNAILLMKYLFNRRYL